MLHISALAAAAASMLLLAPADAMYTKNSPVLQVDSKSYQRLIAQSNYTSIVEFYAPWCGHCKNLKPAYEKVAAHLKGLVKVAAVDCDDESNKPFCGQMGVQGFPTLKIVKPGKTKGKPIVEDYQGGRTAKEIEEAVVNKMKNHVKRLQDEDVDKWLKADNGSAKAILFSEKSQVMPLMKALAIDYLGTIKFGQIRRQQVKSMNLFGIKDVPRLLLLPGGDKDGIVYDGPMKKDGMSKFLSQIAPPNPDSGEAKTKPKAAKKEPKAKTPKASKPKKAADASPDTPPATEETPEPTEPLESPDPIVETEQKPIELPPAAPAPPLQVITTVPALQDRCFTKKSPVCILALLPEEPTDVAAIKALSEIRHKHAERGGKSSFPFYSVSSKNDLGNMLRTKPGADVELVAVSGKRAWIKKYGGDDFSYDSVETWVDAVRMGDGKREKLPEKVENDYIIDEPKEPIVDTPRAEQEPIRINVEDVMSGKMGEDSAFKVEMVEEIPDDHDEL